MIALKKFCLKNLHFKSTAYDVQIGEYFPNFCQKILHKKLAVVFSKYSVQHNSSPMKNHLGISDITFLRDK